MATPRLLDPTTVAPRALWVWDTSDPAAVVRLARERGVGQLYAAVPVGLPGSPRLADLTELVRLAQLTGVRVDALGGDPGWVDDPTRVAEAWLRPALASGLFTGVHVDVEPWTTEEWRTDHATVVTRYLHTLEVLRAAAGAAPLEADIPFWFHEVRVGATTLDREVLRRTDGVVVMAYRAHATGPDGTIELAAAALRAGESLGTPVRIGQETTDLGPDPLARKQTFHGQPLGRMEAELALLVGAYASSPAFAGLAVHDAAGYAAMAP